MLKAYKYRMYPTKAQAAQLAVKNYATGFVVEDLRIKGMVKNRKLSPAIRDVSWGKF